MADATFRSFDLHRNGATWTVFVPVEIVGDADLHDWIVGPGEIPTNRAIARAAAWGGLDLTAYVKAEDLV